MKDLFVGGDLEFVWILFWVVMFVEENRVGVVYIEVGDDEMGEYL